MQPPSSQDHSDELERTLEGLHARSLGWALVCCHWDQEEAQDVLQAVYLKVLDGRARFEERSQFSTWLFGVIRLTAQEERRKRRRRRWLLLERFRYEPEPQAAREFDTLESQQLRRALGQLPARQREVLHLVFYNELSIREAATVMGVGLGTARVHYERGKKRLRESLFRVVGEGRDVLHGR